VSGRFCVCSRRTRGLRDNHFVAEQRTVGVGSVGTAIAYACLIRGSAGALALYDTNAKKVRAEVLDLNHGSRFVPNCLVTARGSSRPSSVTRTGCCQSRRCMAVHELLGLQGSAKTLNEIRDSLNL
jgi:hypothetical protein